MKNKDECEKKNREKKKEIFDLKISTLKKRDKFISKRKNMADDQDERENTGKRLY